MRNIRFTLADSQYVELFNKLAVSLYKHEPGNYVEQVNCINTALFFKGYLVIEKDEILARGILYNSDLRLGNKPLLFFGNFEALVYEAGALLLKTLIDDIQNNYPDAELIGPINGSTWSDYRLAIGSNTSLFPYDIIAKPFYNNLLLDQGFEVLSYYHTHLQTDFSLTQTFITEEFECRFFTKEEFTVRLPEIYKLTMDAFSAAHFFSSISESMFIDKQLKLLPSLNMELLPFIINKENNIVAFAFCYYGWDKKSMVVKTIARKKGRKYAGLGRILSDNIMKIAKEKGIQKIYHAFMHESNFSKNLSIKVNGERIKSYAIYKLRRAT